MIKKTSTKTRKLKKPRMARLTTGAKKFFSIINTVLDPELGVGVVDLGLIYTVTEKPAGMLQVVMTLTSMGCPLGPQISGEIAKVLREQKGVRSVKIEIVWEPPWNPDMMNPEVKAILFGNNHAYPQ